MNNIGNLADNFGAKLQKAVEAQREVLRELQQADLSKGSDCVKLRSAVVKFGLTTMLQYEPLMKTYHDLITDLNAELQAEKQAPKPEQSEGPKPSGWRNADV